MVFSFSLFAGLADTFSYFAKLLIQKQQLSVQPVISAQAAIQPGFLFAPHIAYLALFLLLTYSGRTFFVRHRLITIL